VWLVGSSGGLVVVMVVMGGGVVVGDARDGFVRLLRKVGRVAQNVGRGAEVAQRVQYHCKGGHRERLTLVCAGVVGCACAALATLLPGLRSTSEQCWSTQARTVRHNSSTEAVDTALL
jgi:hypothetical protein